MTNLYCNKNHTELQSLRVELNGNRVALEPLGEVHRQALWDAARPREIWQWTSHRADSRADFDAWIDDSMKGANDSAQTFATLDRRSEAVVGSTSFHHYRPHDGVIEIGSTWLHPRAWGKGLNIEAKLLMLEHAFETLGCVRVEFKTDVRNARSRAALAALPAKFEGILRKQLNVPGIGVRDSAFFSVIDDEWNDVRQNLVRRLSDVVPRPTESG